MRNQVGNPARGEDFFIRRSLIDKAWDFIESGRHILLVAPRRVGKTSLMFHLLDNPKDKYPFLYLITESINNENEFFRRIVNKILKTDLVKNSQKIMTFLEKNMPSIKKVGPDGIEFGVQDEHNYLEILIRILKSISSEGKRLIIMLDEFPETLENIIADDGEGAGRHFLQSNRELRQDPELTGYIQFIYTGSIGLENVASRLNSIKNIIDLSRLPILPLSAEEAKTFIKLLLKNVPFTLSDSLTNYILEKIEWLIPFYIQLIFEKLTYLHRDEKAETITEEMIDRSFNEMLKERNHFEHWHTRLRASFKGNDYNFLKETLNIISENNIISAGEITNLAVKYRLEETYKDHLGSLVYDGYINNNDDRDVYRYNTPVLRMWWRQNVAN